MPLGGVCMPSGLVGHKTNTHTHTRPFLVDWALMTTRRLRRVNWRSRSRRLDMALASKWVQNSTAGWLARVSWPKISLRRYAEPAGVSAFWIWILAESDLEQRFMATQRAVSSWDNHWQNARGQRTSKPASQPASGWRADDQDKGLANAI